MKSSDSSSPSGIRSKKSNSTSKPSQGQVYSGGGHGTQGALSPSSLAPTDSHSMGNASKTQSQTSLTTSTEDNAGNRTTGTRSIAPTIATQPGTTHSDAGRSKAGTFTTGGGAMSTHEPGGAGSTFSSPAPSVRSLTTTLTTIQSTAPGNLLNNTNAPQSSTSTHFSHQFPTTPTPASAIPPRVATNLHGSHPHTYSMATANNLLTDDASVLTLASSTKRRRRNSLDTNASVNALAPSSVFGGSRESLPLSVLSANISGQDREAREQPSQISMNRPTIGTAAAERASIYSAAEGRETRSSYHATRVGGDGASVRSGLLGHGRSESITGSIGGQASPLASPVVLAE